MDLNSFIQECKKRSVLSNLTVYAVAAWLVIQVAATTFPYLGFPEFAVQAVIIMALIGLPITIFLSWYYNIVRDEAEASASSDEISIGKKGNSIINIILVTISISIVIAGFLYLRNSYKSSTIINQDEGEKIAVAYFQNNTQDPELETIGKMVSDYVSHSITRHKLGPVVEYNTVEQSTRISKASLIPNTEDIDLSEIFGKIKLIKGSYYVKDDKLIIQSSLKNSGKSTYVHAFDDIECDLKNPLDCIENLAQLVMGALSIKQQPGVPYDPPKYEAYRYLLKARSENYRNNEEGIKLLKKAIEIDSNYTDAKLNLISSYYDKRNFAQLDSLLIDLESKFDPIDPSEALSPLSILQVQHYRSLLDGDMKAAFRYLDEFYTSKPFNAEGNKTYLVFANEFVNKPELVPGVYEMFNDQTLDYNKCQWCNARLRNVAMAFNSMGMPQKAIEKIEPMLSSSNNREIRQELIKSYILKGDIQKAKDLILDSQKLKLDGNANYLYLVAANECSIQGYLDDRKYFVNMGLEAYDNEWMEHRLKFVDERYDELPTFYEQLLKEDGSDISSIKYLCISYIHLNESKKADALIQYLKSLDSGESPRIPYTLALIYSQQGKKAEMIANLELALKRGQHYNATSFKNDPLLKDYFEDSEFETIMKYWH